MLWCTELPVHVPTIGRASKTNYPHEVCEQALAHSVGSGVERAYRRGDLFDKRRRLMDEWSKYCASLAHGEEQRRGATDKRRSGVIWDQPKTAARIPTTLVRRIP